MRCTPDKTIQAADERGLTQIENQVLIGVHLRSSAAIKFAFLICVHSRPKVYHVD
jgi:hypothetical protein